MKKIKSVSVGIPVYNEEKNIKELLKSLVNQKTSNFILDKVFVLCDGSQDSTPKETKAFAKDYPNLISVVVSKVRKGKMHRLKQIYAMNKSDIVVTFDGDIALSSDLVIENIISEFKNKKIVVVGANNQPEQQKTLTQALLNTWFWIWYEIRTNINNGDNAFNLRGCAMALEKNFAKTIVFPNNLTSDSKFIFALAKYKGLKFKFAKNANVYYLLPNNLHDYFLQKRRSIDDSRVIKSIFGENAFGSLDVPIMLKIKSIAKMMNKHPVLTPLSISLILALRYYRHYKKNSVNNKQWAIASSTKGQIKVLNYQRSTTH